MATDPGCAHELVRLPIVAFSADYLCRLCFTTFEMRLTPEAMGASLDDVGHLAAATFGGTVVGEGCPQWPDAGLKVFLKGGGEAVVHLPGQQSERASRAAYPAGTSVPARPPAG